ncbi:MAG TPA: NADH-quinone oxidoreductase subunit M, partial [Aquificaceae bacterium]|nr:NADH-quinone oxidoreductase subunit M [Aquificaceae bacterium]
FSAGFLYDRIHSYNMDDLGGLARYIPNFAVLFMVSGLASIGLPGLAGFIAEFLVLLGTFKSHPVWAVIAGIGMVLGAAYFLYMYRRVMFEEDTVPEARKERWSKLNDVEAHHITAFVFILLASFILGLYPAPFVRIVEHTAKLVLGG